MHKKVMTLGGFERLREELDQLWRVERPQVTEKVKWAASLGDRSENADYQYNKKRLREIDRRVRYLSKVIEHAEVIDRLPADQHKVFFGAWVEVENQNEEQLRFRIVGEDEIYHHDQYISFKSPLARAALGKEVDDEFTVRTELAINDWVILSIEYPAL